MQQSTEDMEGHGGYAMSLDAKTSRKNWIEAEAEYVGIVVDAGRRRRSTEVRAWVQA